MTTKEKTHTLKLSEKEIAAILFLIYKVNGRAPHQIWDRCKSILSKYISSSGDIGNKHKSLSKVCGYDNPIHYLSVEKEWEAFLGIGEKGKNKEVLSKIADVERELAELRWLL